MGELIGRLTDDLKLLTRQEVELAKHELGQKLSAAKPPAGALAVGAAALSGGLLVLLLAGVLALSTVMAAWAAALIVGSLVSAIGAGLVVSGSAKLSRLSLTPERAFEGVKRDVAAIKRAAT